MFCDQCGATLQPDYILCPKCGKALLKPLTPLVVYRRSRLEQHLRTLGTLWIVCGALFLIPAFGMLAVGHMAGYMIHGEEIARTLGPLVMYLIGGGLFVIAAGGICVGWGLMRQESWARIAAIVLGILALFHLPFGTALGIYTLWVLLANGAGHEYEQMVRAA